MATSGSMSAELSRIVEINEEIKKVVRISFAINLMAINAILTARRAGRAARGFSVLSNELRQFTSSLEAVMGRLRGLTCRAVVAVSQKLQHDQISRVLRRADALRSSPSLTEIIERRAQEEVSLRTEILGVQTALVQALRDANQIGEHGRVLARNAKIEAAYAGEHSHALTHVSTHFEQTVDQILASLAILNQHNEHDA